ncbi:MAG TPA: DUF4019 domain-containing protein [Polyangiales bacterium]|nr:DUF4019 domain-containing protein [Polyangiales bacterium]
MMRRLLILIALALFANVAFAQVDAHAGDEFLALVDAKKYSQAYDACSDYLKQSISRGEWTSQLVKERETIGTLASRKLIEAKPIHDMPGAPKGDYLLLTYASVFASQGKPMTETLPMIKAPDGRWRPVGYFVR